jgi:hypothetical protein
VLGASRSGYDGSRQRALSTSKVCAIGVQLKAEFAASGHALAVSDNVLARRFDPSGPNQTNHLRG